MNTKFWLVVTMLLAFATALGIANSMITQQYSSWILLGLALSAVAASIHNILSMWGRLYKKSVLGWTAKHNLATAYCSSVATLSMGMIGVFASIYLEKEMQWDPALAVLVIGALVWVGYGMSWVAPRQSLLRRLGS